MFYTLTEDDIDRIRRVRKEQFNALTYDQKITMSMIAYRFSLGEPDFPKASKHLYSAIKFLFEKIEKEHCLSC